MGILPGLCAANLGLERREEQRQVPVAFDPPQSRFDGQQCAGDPALFLIRRAPPIDLVGNLAMLGIERFQTVRGFQSDPERWEETQPM